MRGLDVQRVGWVEHLRDPTTIAVTGARWVSQELDPTYNYNENVDGRNKSGHDENMGDRK